MQSAHVLGCEPAAVATGVPPHLLRSSKRPITVRHEGLQFGLAKKFAPLGMACRNAGTVGATGAAASAGGSTETLPAAAEERGEKQETKLWGGRFEKPVTPAVERFSQSVSYDKQLYKQDLKGSRAHAQMLAKQVRRCPLRSNPFFVVALNENP